MDAYQKLARLIDDNPELEELCNLGKFRVAGRNTVVQSDPHFTIQDEEPDTMQLRLPAGRYERVTTAVSRLVKPSSVI